MQNKCSTARRVISIKVTHEMNVKRLETRLVHGELTAVSCFIIATKTLRSFFSENPPFRSFFTGGPFTRKAWTMLDFDFGYSQ